MSEQTQHQQENLTLERHLKKTTVLSNLVTAFIAVITACGTVYAFYYETNSQMQLHANDIKEVKYDVNAIKDKLQESAVFEGVTKSEVKAVQDKVNGIETKVDKMNDKLDMILMQTKNK